MICNAAKPTITSRMKVSNPRCRRALVHWHRLKGPSRGCWFRVQTVAAEEADSSGKAFSPPTVTTTKKKFLENYTLTISPIYNTALQEILVQQHFVRYNIDYQYDAVFALGVATMLDQLLSGYKDEETRKRIFDAYIKSLDEDPAKYRADVSLLEEWAKSRTAENLTEFDGEEIPQKLFQDIATRASGAGSFKYSRFFAVGVFRMLELSNVSDPKVLKAMAEAFNLDVGAFNKDLDIYRSLLSKMTSAKDLMREFLEREKKKQDERQSKKADAETESMKEI